MKQTRRNDPCSCGSGRKYKHCCGRLTVSSGEPATGDAPVSVSRFSHGAEFKASGYLAQRIQTPEQFEEHCSDQPPGQPVGSIVLPRGIMARGDFINPDTCRSVIEFADQQDGFESTVQDSDQMTDIAASNLQSADRVSWNIDIRDIYDQVVPVIASAYREAEKFFGVEIEWFEYPELLRYTKGGRYLPHADAENWDSVTGQWQRGMDRDLSIIIYLNGEFEGGQLDFPNFGFRLKPRPGLLACFPADHRYVHTARPVESGVRYILVSWAAARGTPRVHKDMPVTAVPMSATTP